MSAILCLDAAFSDLISWLFTLRELPSAVNNFFLGYQYGGVFKGELYIDDFGYSTGTSEQVEEEEEEEEDIEDEDND